MTAVRRVEEAPARVDADLCRGVGAGEVAMAAIIAARTALSDTAFLPDRLGPEIMGNWPSAAVMQITVADLGKP